MSDGGRDYPVPDARPKVEKVPCPECNKPVAPDYLSTHRRNQHGIVQRRSKYDRSLPGKDVVETVLGVIFPDGVPVRHLDAVIRWRAATVTFLREVEDV